ncbi:Tubulin-specific chaperone A [Meloidogyne graminicola]|uniref:Tubulin-specific chaperone A n=1 Tax=Meloidogyne graminicola TaxID=189291 RepID=A0A8S9ZLX5_9BILA|nr:Tubulin-specific chaperone A [Meloidogyne graminicola]
MSEKDLKIKTGVLRRYLQEANSYKSEVQKQSTKIAAMKESQEPDQYMIKKALEVQQENQQMFCLASKNVQKARIDLEALLTSSQENGELKTNAQEIIQKALEFENTSNSF